MRQMLLIDDLRVVVLDRLDKVRRQLEGFALRHQAAAITVGSSSAQSVGLFLEQVDAGGVGGGKLDNLEHAELQDFIGIERLRGRDRENVQKVSVATP